MIDYDTKAYNINNCSTVFKLPIHYLENKSILEKNIHSDLELTELKDNSNNCLYDNVFEPKNDFSKITTKMWSQHFTTDTEFLKDSQQLYKSIRNIKQIEKKDIDELINVYDEIKNDYSFRDRYNYVEWQFLDYLNYNPMFLLILTLLNITSPLFSLILPVVILFIPLLVLKIQNFEITLEKYLSLLTYFGKMIPLINIINFKEMSIDKKVMTSVSIVIYFFTIYQNIMSVYRFHKNMYIVHKYIEKIRSFNTISIENIDNFLIYSNSLKTYDKFNDELIKHKKVLVDINNNLNNINPYSLSIRKIFDLGNVMSYFYTIYNSEILNNSLLYCFGFYGFLENIIAMKINLTNKHLNICKFSKNKISFKKSFYAPLKHENPITNDFSLDKNIIITGPNAAGKTTILKSTLFNIILSQQIGCGFYESAKIKPFDNIHCYLNIPDTSNRDSLFQAEARRCKDIIDVIDCDKTKTHFCIFDELYSGTNPYEAVASALSYLSYLCNNKNIKFILTTHYVELCKKLDAIQNEKIVNKHMKVNPDNNGNFKFTYKLTDKISNIKGGIKVLKDLKYPKQIIDSTEKYINLK
tara:strand:+ start:807 stop:2552 length:1746 start_codon:yes stop_codon:yes gene_type:complete